MKIGLLECDHVSEKYLHISGTYRDMFSVLLPQLELHFFDVCKGHFPDSVHDCEGFICTGSKNSVYENIAWVNELKDFVVQAFKKHRKFVGVCFGHQMLAEALGGKVLKNGNGWNVGIHPFEMLVKEPWMDPVQQKIELLMMCQDQVVHLPENSTLLAYADDCSIGMFKVGDHMLGIQAHPEFSNDYEKALMEDRLDKIGSEKVEKAIDSLKKQSDKELIASWIVNFLKN